MSKSAPRTERRTGTHGRESAVDHDFADGETRALVTHDGQALPATVRATDAMLDERLVCVGYDRYPSREMRPIGGVRVVFADEGTVDLGVDRAGGRHLWSPHSNLVWVLGTDGDVEQSYDLDSAEHADKDVRTWTQYVAHERGWVREGDTTEGV